MTVELQGLTVRYGGLVAVDAVSCRFPRGACGLLGRNGAGKSSILRALLGLVRAASGSMRILGLDERARGAELRSRIGYMPERDAHVAGATGFEMVSLLGRLSGMPRRQAWRRAHEVLYLVGLEEQRYRAVSTYSLGMRQKAKLAAALVHDPEVLFLDEPTNGLDPSGREEMLGLIGRLAGEHGKSIVLSTHILQDVETVCDAVVVLDGGKVVSQGSIAELTAAAGRRFGLVVDPSDLELPGELGNGTRIERIGAGRFMAWLPEAADSRALFRAVGERGGAVRRFGAARRSLEEVFFGALELGKVAGDRSREPEGQA